jgi:valyl-tRNA synthetase
MVTVVTNDAKLYMPLAELVDLQKERERIEKELKKAQDDLDRTVAKLSNEGFVSKAPANVVAAERERVEKTKALIENLKETLNGL